jgi:hypothetical protein
VIELLVAPYLEKLGCKLIVHYFWQGQFLKLLVSRFKGFSGWSFSEHRFHYVSQFAGVFVLLGSELGDFSVLGKLPKLQLRAIRVMRHVSPPLKYGEPNAEGRLVCTPFCNFAAVVEFPENAGR